MGFGKSNRGTGYSGQIKLGNKTWINNQHYPTTVEQINFSQENINNKHKRAIISENLRSGIIGNGLSLNQNQLKSLLICPATASDCACCCVPAGSTPSYQIKFNGDCPYVDFTACSGAVKPNDIQITFRPNDGQFWLNYGYYVCLKGVVHKNCIGPYSCSNGVCPKGECGNGPNGTTYCYDSCGSGCN